MIHANCRLMYRVAASVLRSDCEAADAVQDAVLRLYERRKQLKDVTNVRQYCLSAVRNTCLNIMRSRKEYVGMDKISDIESDEDVYDAVEWKNLSDCVIKAMERLPDDQKRVLQLSAFGGLSNAEIAELLNTTTGNVRVMLSRGRAKIKELLSK